MDDLRSEVVGEAHEVGAWRGPTRGPWLQRIVAGAGFTPARDERRLLTGGSIEGRPGPTRRSATPATPTAPATPAAPAVVAEPAPLADTFRLWWLPRAHEP